MYRISSDGDCIYEAILYVSKGNHSGDASFVDVQEYCLNRWGWKLRRAVFGPIVRDKVLPGKLSNDSRGFYKCLPNCPVIKVGKRYRADEYPESKLPHPYEHLTKEDQVLLF